MWKEQRNGKCRYSERYSDPLTGKLRKVSVTLDRKSDKKAYELLQAKIKDATRPSGAYTLRQAADLYLADQKLTVQESTYKNKEFALNYVISIFGEYNKMDKLSAGYLRSCLLSTGKSTKTMNGYMKTFKPFINWAYRNDMIASRACIEKFQLFDEPPEREKIDNKYLEAEEFKLLLEGIRDEGYRLITEFIGLSGLRIGEVIALNTSDISETEIEIDKNYGIRINKVKSTKTECSYRTLHMQPELKDCVNRLTAFMERRKWMLGIVVPYWLVNRAGNRIHYHDYLRCLKTTSEKVLGRRITPHVLRHTHASLLSENDIELDTISRRLGHRNSKITKDIYVHVTRKQLQKDAEELDKVRIFAPNLPPTNAENL